MVRVGKNGVPAAKQTGGRIKKKLSVSRSEGSKGYTEAGLQCARACTSKSISTEGSHKPNLTEGDTPSPTTHFRNLSLPQPMVRRAQRCQHTPALPDEGPPTFRIAFSPLATCQAIQSPCLAVAQSTESAVDWLFDERANLRRPARENVEAFAD